MNNGTISILVVDDHSLMREGIKALLATSDDMRVVGEAGNGQEAIDMARQHSPHVILMDLSLPVINGTEAIRHIKQRSNQTKIIAVTAYKSADHIHASLDSGADGYVLKDDTSDDLISAIRKVMSGKIFLSTGICDKVVHRFREHPGDNSSGRSGYWGQLTPRERQIIKMIAEGQKNREIAEKLSISIKTVEKHRSNLMKKLDLHSISALTTFAIDQNIISP